jgi:penicillin V acylase-like amidase (Ntn superfamily)
MVRISPFLFGLHYLVADRSRSIAVVEFLKGKRVVHTGDGLPVPVLAIDTYRNWIRCLVHHVGFGGTRVVLDGPESPERFVRAATLSKEHEEGKNHESPTGRVFQILGSVEQSDTQWTIEKNLQLVHPAFSRLGEILAPEDSPPTRDD